MPDPNPENEDLEALKTKLDKVTKERDSLAENVETLKGEVSTLKDETSKLKEILAADNPDTEKLVAEHTEMKKTLQEATTTLQGFVDAKKTALIDAITKETDLCPDELQEMSLDQLTLVMKTVDSFKGTKKSVKSAGPTTKMASQHRNITMPDLYGQPQDVDSLKQHAKAGAD